jgi:hypothetical protein
MAVAAGARIPIVRDLEAGGIRWFNGSPALDPGVALKESAGIRERQSVHMLGL